MNFMLLMVKEPCDSRKLPGALFNGLFRC